MIIHQPIRFEQISEQRCAVSLCFAGLTPCSAEMAKIIKADETFERIEEPREKSLALCQELGQQFKYRALDYSPEQSKALPLFD